jgi:hypothetical protein
MRGNGEEAALLSRDPVQGQRMVHHGLRAKGFRGFRGFGRLRGFSRFRGFRRFGFGGWFEY